MKCKFRWTAALIALACAVVPVIPHQRPASPNPSPIFPGRVLEGAEDFNLAFMLQGDLRGNYGPCGPSRLGGFARRMRYWNAFAEKYPRRPVLRLDAGSVFSVGGAESAVINRWMLEGTYRSRLDALNLSAWDIPAWHQVAGLASAGTIPREFMSLPLVSANVTPKLEGFPVVQRYLVKDTAVAPAGTFRVGITGLLYDIQGRTSRADFRIDDPQAAAREVAQELQSRSDYSVFLIDGDLGKAISLAAVLPSIDMIVAAHNYDEPAEPHQVGQTLIILPANEGRLLSEIRVAIPAGSDTLKVTARFVPLDRTMPDDPSMGELIRNAQSAVDELRRAR